MNKAKVYGTSFVLKKKQRFHVAGDGGELILESNLHFQYCNQIAKDNMFLDDLLAWWCKIDASESTHVIAKEII